MEVIETVERYPVVGYALRGYPSDLAWYEEGMEPGNYAVIQTGTSRYYMTDQEALERLKDADDVLVGLVREYELFLDVPLQVGKVFL